MRTLDFHPNDSPSPENRTVSNETVVPVPAIPFPARCRCFEHSAARAAEARDKRENLDCHDGSDRRPEPRGWDRPRISGCTLIRLMRTELPPISHSVKNLRDRALD
ncbi:hypothetical protein [Nocardia sp. NPDC052316]|uniref:hypothetical protein n=1 Tax=Nocardia sp. NPDC052316 TaxID=3364329 RepID=UPI0037CBC05C